MSGLAFPFGIDARGRSAVSDGAAHIREMIRLVLFTTPGERVNRPDFGCGVAQLVFEPNSALLASASGQLIHGALQRWLGNVILVEAVEVAAADAVLTIDVAWRERGRADQRQTARFQKALPQ